MRLRVLLVPLGLLSTLTATVIACGSNGDDSSFPDGPPTSSGEAGSDPNDPHFGEEPDAETSDGGACAAGSVCEGGGVCIAGSCCAAGKACGDVCCAGAAVCSFGACVTPGAACSESSDCADGSYCEFSLGSTAGKDGGAGDGGPGDGGVCVGAQSREGKCLPKPPLCAPGGSQINDAGALVCLNACEYRPPVATSLTPVTKYTWGGEVTTPFASDVMMTPIVVELDDDDCDGKVTARDIPDIVFSTFSSGAYRSSGVLHAISILENKVVEKSWTVTGINPTRQLAGGNIDGVSGSEIVGCFIDGSVKAIKADGTTLWSTPSTACYMPSIADLDQDGTPEVIVEGGILDGKTGALKHTWEKALQGPPVVSDIDGDGKLDIVTGPQAFHGDGKIFVDTGIGATSSFEGTSDWKFPGAAIADFDRDGKPEIVVMHNLSHTLSVWRYDAAAPNKFVTVRADVDINGALSPALCASGTWGNTHGGGPPTVADFDGDGTPDIALAGGVGYAVIDGKKLVDPTVPAANAVLWSKRTTDCSSAQTGSTVFDFDGDGKAEVVYSDERFLRIYEGRTGNVLFETCNTTATLIENPIVADVDNDGQADIVVASNAYNSSCADDGSKRYSGIRVFGDAAGKWVRTRRVWNEHAYHITNVEEDGTIPTVEKANITSSGLNNFRQNKQPGGEFAAPDLVVSVAPRCPGPTAVVATVRNLGEAIVPAGIDVAIFKGTPPAGTQFGATKTTRALYPAESEDLTFVFGAGDADARTGAVPVYASVTPPASVHECRADNNTSPPVAMTCGGPK